MIYNVNKNLKYYSNLYLKKLIQHFNKRHSRNLLGFALPLRRILMRRLFLAFLPGIEQWWAYGASLLGPPEFEWLPFDSSAFLSCLFCNSYRLGLHIKIIKF